MKKQILTIFGVICLGLGVTASAQSLGGGNSTINQLDPWKISGAAITQSTTNKPVKITGPTPGGCLQLTSQNIATTTGSPCGGGSDNNWTVSGGVLTPTTTISVTVRGTTTLATTTTSFLNGVIHVTGFPFPKSGTGVIAALAVCKIAAYFCGGVHVAPATYTFTAPLTAYSGMTLWGDNASTTVFFLANGANTNLVTSPATGLEYVRIWGITFDGNGANQTGAGSDPYLVSLTGSDILLRNNHLDHIVIKNAYKHCFFFTGQNNGRHDPNSVTYSYIYNCGVGSIGYGLYYDYSPETTFAFNYIETVNGGDAVEMGNLGQGHVFGNTIVGNASGGGQLQFPFSSNSDISFNWVYNSTIQNDANRADNMTIIGNHVINSNPTSGFACISAYGATSTITGNFCQMATGTAYRVFGWGGNSISNNHATCNDKNASTSIGYYIEQSSNNTLDNNFATGCSRDYIITHDNNQLYHNTGASSTVGVEYSDSSRSGHVSKGNRLENNIFDDGVTYPYKFNNQADQTNRYEFVASTGNHGVGTTTPMGRETFELSSSTAVLVVSQNGTGDVFNSLYGGVSVMHINAATRITPDKKLILEHTTGDLFFDLEFMGDTSNDYFSINSNSGLGVYKDIRFQGQGTDNLVISRNGRTGIASSSPYAALSVDGKNSSVPIFTLQNTGVDVWSTTGSTTRMAPTTTLIVTHTPGNFFQSLNISANISGQSYGFDSVAGVTNAYPIKFLMQGIAALTVDSNGNNRNVGVGTTSPFSKFAIHAYNGETNQSLFTIASSTASATTTLFSISNVGSTTAANGFNITAGCFAISSTCLSLSNLTGIVPLAGGGTATSTFYSGGVVFSDATKLTQAAVASSFFWDNTNARLGLGNSSPASRLTVTQTSSGGDVIALLGENLGGAANSNTILSLRPGNLSTARVYFGAAAPGGSDAEATIYTSNNNGAPTEKVRINDVGNFGIGVTSPQSTVSIKNAGAIGWDDGSSAKTFISLATSTLNGLLLSSGSGGTSPSLYLAGNLFTATADKTLNSTSPTTAFGTGNGTLTIPANSLRIGKKFNITGAGYYSTPLGNVSTVTLTTSIASSTATTISTVTTAALPASATNLPFNFNMTCTVRSIGAAATLVCDGMFDYNTALTGIVKTTNSISTVGTVTFDSTVNETLDVKVSWSAVTTQTATVQESSVDYMN